MPPSGRGIVSLRGNSESPPSPASPRLRSASRPRRAERHGGLDGNFFRLLGVVGVLLDVGSHLFHGRRGLFGGSCLLKTIEEVGYANYLCDELGVDTISAGVVISWAMECYEKGLITKKDTDGLELVWGNFEAMIEMLNKLAYREGFGNFLADGAVRAAEKLGKDPQ